MCRQLETGKCLCRGQPTALCYSGDSHALMSITSRQTGWLQLSERFGATWYAGWQAERTPSPVIGIACPQTQERGKQWRPLDFLSGLPIRVFRRPDVRAEGMGKKDSCSGCVFANPGSPQDDIATGDFHLPLRPKLSSSALPRLSLSIAIGSCCSRR